MMELSGGQTLLVADGVHGEAAPVVAFGGKTERQTGNWRSEDFKIPPVNQGFVQVKTTHLGHVGLKQQGAPEPNKTRTLYT